MSEIVLTICRPDAWVRRGRARNSPETLWRHGNVAHLIWRRPLAGRCSALGSRSILRGFPGVGSNFLPLGTPLLNAGQPGLRSIAVFIGTDCHFLSPRPDVPRVYKSITCSVLPTSSQAHQ